MKTPSKYTAEIANIVLADARKRFGVRIMVGRFNRPYMQVVDVERDEDDRVIAHDNVTSKDSGAIVALLCRLGATVLGAEQLKIEQAIKRAEKMIARRTQVLDDGSATWIVEVLP